MLSLDDAEQTVLANAEARPVVTVEILQSLGAALAEDVPADRDQPAFDKSAMDGFAVRSEDLAHAGTLTLHPSVIAAGVWPDFTLAPGQAAKIMTGAPIPAGADAVQIVEESRVDDGSVEFFTGVRPGENVRRRGEELRKGDIAVARGTRVTPSVLGVLAGLGRTVVQAYDPPVVGVLTTGSEIVEYNETPGPSQIRNSNSLTLLGLLYRHGIEGGYIGAIPDDLERISASISTGIGNADILLITGGASEGDFDLVGEAIQRIGATVLFDKVAIKPGKPVSFAKIGSRALFSLPGNPVSAIVAFHLLVDPYIKKIMGCVDPLPRRFPARLTAPFKKNGPRRHFVPAVCRYENSGLDVEPVRFRGSADIIAFSKANCLMVVAEGDRSLSAGEKVDIQLLEDPNG